MRKKYGIKIETSWTAGRYRHEVYDVYECEPDETKELSDKVVEALKRVNEEVWKEMPEGARELVTRIQYELPQKRKFPKIPFLDQIARYLFK